MAFLEVERLEKNYRGMKVLDSISFSVERGCVLGIVGSNGVGKSTLIKILATIIRPSSGRFTLNGNDGVAFRHKVNRFIGYLGERAPLYTELTVENFLFFMAGLRGLRSNERRKYVDLAMEETFVSKRKDFCIASLSRGWQQRVALAASIIGEIDLLLLDEPSSGLDPLQSRSMRELILNQKKKNKTIIFSSHHISEVEAICDEVLLLDGEGHFSHFHWKNRRLLSSNFIDQASIVNFEKAFLYFIKMKASKINIAHWAKHIENLAEKTGFSLLKEVKIEKIENGINIFFHDISTKIQQKKMDKVCAEALRYVCEKSSHPIMSTGYKNSSLENIFLSLHNNFIGDSAGDVGGGSL